MGSSSATQTSTRGSSTLRMSRASRRTFYRAWYVSSVDDRPQDYRIDFKTMTQMNTSSRYVRRIDREMIDQGPVECMFEYLNEHNAWVAYDTADQVHINQAFNAYRLGGPGTVSMHLAGRPEIYRLNFAAAKQTNMNSNTDRSMRRR
jgi:hypothetical protein